MVAAQIDFGDYADAEAVAREALAVDAPRSVGSTRGSAGSADDEVGLKRRGSFVGAKASGRRR